ncbi:MAG: hypothetical protein IKW59_07905 [Clostridia bacterium]|nr:hypothetical protein [Clostridia bacterium]
MNKNTFYYKVAELVFKIEGYWPRLAQGRLKKYEIEEPENGLYDVRYKISANCDAITMPKALKSVEVNRRHWMVHEDGGYSMVDFIPEISDKIINRIDTDKDWTEISVELCSEEICGFDEKMRAYNSFGETLPFVLFERNGMVLHSSCIEYNGNAILFSAPSGTGKSTHTRLWKEYYPKTNIINDDMPALRILTNENGEQISYAFGTPWSGKTQTNSNICAPVRAIVFLKQAKENSIRRVTGAEAAFLIMQGIRIATLEEHMSASLDNAAQLLKLVPAYELSCNISKAAVETVKRELGI